MSKSPGVRACRAHASCNGYNPTLFPHRGNHGSLCRGGEEGLTTTAFALLSAFGFAWTYVFMQLGLRGARISPFTALLINLVGGTLALVAAVCLLGAYPPYGVSPLGFLYFALAGLMAGRAGQAANFAAIHRIGATRTASLTMTDNLFALVIALLVLGQSISLVSGAGIVILMVGALAFVRETAGNSEVDTEDVAATFPDLGAEETRMGALGSVALAGAEARAGSQCAARTERSGMAFAILSGLLFASAGVLRALGVNEMPVALFGAAINITVALLVIVAVYAVGGKLREPFSVGWKRGAYLLLSGVASAMGTAGFMLALQYGGAVAITTALKNTAPIFTFVFAMVFLRRHERLGAKVALLVILVVCGGALAAFGRG